MFMLVNVFIISDLREEYFHPLERRIYAVIGTVETNEIYKNVFEYFSDGLVNLWIWSVTPIVNKYCVPKRSLHT